jgi:glycosyltransferase involved in cell wall biosynthesis
MKLILVTPYFPAHGGGVELVAGRIAQGLAEDHGYEVEWFASECDPAPVHSPEQLTFRPMACWNGIERKSGISYPVWGASAYFELEKSIRSADVVHIHEFAYISSLMALTIAKKYEVPVLLTQHMGVVCGPSKLPGIAHRGLEFMFARLAFRAVRHTAFISVNSRHHYTHLLPAEGCASTIFNGVDTDDDEPASTASTLQEMASARNAIRARMGLPPVGHGAVILFVGRLVAKKGTGIVRAVASALPSVKFLVAGRSPQGTVDWGSTQLEELGYVSPSCLRDLYKAADLLFLPSYNEGFPLVVQEALVQGCRVLTTEEVASACPAAGKLINTCPVPRSDDPSPWLAALASGLLDTESPEVRARRASIARQLWSWRASIEAYSELIENHICGRSRLGNGLTV